MYDFFFKGNYIFMNKYSHVSLHFDAAYDISRGASVAFVARGEDLPLAVCGQ